MGVTDLGRKLLSSLTVTAVTLNLVDSQRLSCMSTWTVFSFLSAYAHGHTSVVCNVLGILVD